MFPAPACARAPVRAPAVARSLRRIVEISGDDRVLGTDDDAGRLEPDFGAMRAEVALGGGAVVGIDVNGVVRARLHASFATDAALGVEIDDAVFALVHRGHRADRHAGRILAMIAARDLKDAASVGECSLLDVLDPGAIHGQGDVVLGLAGDSAGVTADALAVIDDESVSHSGSLFRQRRRTAVRLGYCIRRGFRGY